MIAQADWGGLEMGEVVRLARFLDAYSIAAGTVLFREGDREAFMGLLVSGRATVHARGRSAGSQVEIATIERGGTIGETSLLDGKPRETTVQIAEACTLLVLTEHNFARLIEESPRLVLRMVLHIYRQASQHLRAMSHILAEQLER